MTDHTAARRITELDPPDVEDFRLIRSFEGRCGRLSKFVWWLEARNSGDESAPNPPEIVVGAEIDLVRQALDRLELRFVPNHAEHRRDRAQADALIASEIAEIGQEAYDQRTLLELGEPEGTA